MNLSTEPVQLVLSHLFIPSLDVSFLFMCACAYNFQRKFMIWIYRYMCAYLCTPLGIRNTTLWGALTPLDAHVQILELKACGFSLLLIRVAQRKRGSAEDPLRLYPSRSPCSALEFFCYDSEPSFVQFMIVYLLIFSHFRLSGDVIFL